MSNLLLIIQESLFCRSGDGYISAFAIIKHTEGEIIYVSH